VHATELELTLAGALAESSQQYTFHACYETIATVSAWRTPWSQTPLPKGQPVATPLQPLWQPQKKRASTEAA
jgi:hypothetical protein